MYNHILVAVALDHSPHADDAIQVARTLANDGSRITALHVVEDIPAYVANQLPEGLLIDRASTAKTELKAEIGNRSDIHPEVVHGHAGGTIVSYAKTHDVDCIVIASHKPGLQDFFLGSTATRVVRHAACAVHVLR